MLLHIEEAFGTDRNSDALVSSVEHVELVLARARLTTVNTCPRQIHLT